MDTGRWTIVSRATPQVRRPSQPYLRARVHVRCVCGLERTIWLEDLEAQRSTGCESRRCAARYRASSDIRTMLSGWIQREYEAITRVAAQLPESDRERIETLAKALLSEHTSVLDEAIAEYLHAPRLLIGEPEGPSVCFARRA